MTRLLCLSLLGLVFCGSSAGSDTSDAALLSLRLAIPGSVCTSQTEVPVDLFLTNDGPQEVAVTSKGFGTGITYFALYDSIAGSFRREVMGTVGDWLSELNADSTRALSHGESYRIVMKLQLPKKIFDRAGFYKIQVRYSGTATDRAGASRKLELLSNWSVFETQDCAAVK